MRITALAENTTKRGLKTVHGLSLYIETGGRRLLFDLGPDETLFENSRALGIDLTKVDTVIVSHGHNDHGGALAAFLDINNTARVYVQRKAFEKHYSMHGPEKESIGLDARLADHPQVVLLDGDHSIDDELRLFTVSDTSKCYSTANDTLFQENGKDDFSHEQNLLISGERSVMIIGCGHTGIVNIMEKAAGYRPALCVGGFHLFNPSAKKTVPYELLDRISEKLGTYATCFYTCHCTGMEAFAYLSERNENVRYLSCGDSIEA